MLLMLFKVGREVDIKSSELISIYNFTDFSNLVMSSWNSLSLAAAQSVTANCRFERDQSVINIDVLFAISLRARSNTRL